MSSESPDRGLAGAVPRSPEGPIPAGTFGLQVKTVSEVSRAIRERVRADERLRDLWVEGEVGRVTISSAGPRLLRAEGRRAPSSSACGSATSAFDRRSSPRPGCGSSPTGGSTCTRRRARSSCTSTRSSRRGGGPRDPVRAAEGEAGRRGAVRAERKRPLPSRPAVVAVVTSPTGAAWKDVCHVFARRWPLARVVLVACQVQGDGRRESIVRALRRIERTSPTLTRDGPARTRRPRVTILARGGGSMEDLWSFNDERVVRAIVAHPCRS